MLLESALRLGNALAALGKLMTPVQSLCSVWKGVVSLCPDPTLLVGVVLARYGAPRDMGAPQAQIASDMGTSQAPNR